GATGPSPSPPMVSPSLSPPPPRRRKALALALVGLLFLGSAFLVLANLDAIQRFFRGVPDNNWAFVSTQADGLHALGLTGAGVVVCIVDSGIDLGHPDLAGVEPAAWRDFVGREPEPYDDHGHGTFMAGLIVGRGLIRGFAPDVALVVAKAIDASGVGNGADILGALAFCMNPFGNGTQSHIISLSLGGGGVPAGPVVDRVNEAIDRGILVVAAAGNDGPSASDIQNPASLDLVIAVGSVDDGLTVSGFSQGGQNGGRLDPNKKPEVVAPGEGLATTGLGGSYVSVAGTSAASAIVSAILALVLEGEPSLQGLLSALGVSGIKVALMATAAPLDGQAEPHDRLAGYGLIQGVDLLEALRLGA
ncbi:MAG: S8 family serine peptidase, partial [Thermoplasmata archaeon]|nr:S8 family serine peptidase [Thermoplasmata archaeon]